MTDTNKKPAAKKVTTPEASASTVPKPSASIAPKTVVAAKAAPKTAAKIAPKASASPAPKASVAADPKASASVAPKKRAPVQRDSAKEKSPRVSNEQRYWMVAEAAYFRAESHGFKSDPVRDWIEAENDIAALLSGGK